MDFRNKLKTRLYVAVIYMALGVSMIAGTFGVKTDNSFISAFGFALVVMGAVRIRNYRRITKDEESLRKQEITETDERNLAIIHKARSAAFTACFLLSGTAVIVLSLFERHEEAKWLAYPVLLLALLYWGFYWWYQKKL